MEILDKKSNRMSRVIIGVSEANLLAILESLNELVHLEFLTDPKLQRILDFLSLRNLLSNELFFTFSNSLFFYLQIKKKLYNS
ncbi:riboflavin synthase subunit alpha [Fusobacterium pseudoperiodonticum]|uniref:Riboflavin synthase subunit alpha n=1 Tax=Fusobacterium pseudoperiodonticum TaxID=2663009 RepID=A0A2D3PSJ3_9FUSO|nr:riboflavin synthase subunit alpha [Fusobacterium pseudoperiodonticum]ATV70086.1 riboflavin synthase subunit alpha [Fusobacterium pseudoperiodonticum]